MYRRNKENKMDTIINVPRHIKLAGAMLAIAALVITLLAVNFAAGPAQAQSKTYPDPQPCGQGHAKVPGNPVDQITTGEIAFFDAYWHIKTKTINNNLCPPAITEQDDGLGNKTITRTDAKIDIAKSVIHVTDTHKVTVINSSAAGYNPNAVSGPTIDLAEYRFLAKGLGLGANEAPEAGTQVYWLRLDDPDTDDEDETSDLVLGFSTKLFESKYWESRSGNKPFYYEFESERDNIFEVHGPHFFAFAAPRANNGVQNKAIWDSYDPDTNQMQMEAGVEFQGVQWVFTEPGTHHIQVHAVGHVNENVTGASDDWKQNLPEEKTVTSEVRTYTIQSGPLSFNQQPMFQVERSVAENSPAGVKVGDPVMVTGGDDGDTLTYGLRGKGSSHFEVASVSGGAQVTVARGARLDYETRPTYDLVLGVSDGKDREGQDDPSIDSTVALKISLTDVTGPAKVTIEVDEAAPATGATVTLTSTLSGDIPPPELVEYIWIERDLESNIPNVQINGNNEYGTTSVSVTHSTEGKRRYQAHLYFYSHDGQSRYDLEGASSNLLDVKWADKP